MAYRYFGINFGQHEFDITESASPIGADVELRVQESNVPLVGTNNDIMVKLQELENYFSGKTTINN